MEANAGESFQMQILLIYSPTLASIASKFQSNAENTNMVYYHVLRMKIIISLRTFAPKSFYREIFFISRLELGHEVLTPKMKRKKKKNGGHRLRFGENGNGKMP